MDNNFEKAINKIIESPKLSERLAELKTKNEIYNFFVEVGGNMDRNKFDMKLEKILGKNEIDNNDLEKISGGKLPNALKKGTALAMGALALGTSVAPSTQALSKRAKIITGVVTGGAAAATLGTAVLTAALIGKGIHTYNKNHKNSQESPKDQTVNKKDVKDEVLYKIKNSNECAKKAGDTFFEIIAEDSSINKNELQKELNRVLRSRKNQENMKTIDFNSKPQNTTQFAILVLTDKEFLNLLPQSFFEKLLKTEAFASIVNNQPKNLNQVPVETSQLPQTQNQPSQTQNQNSQVKNKNSQTQSKPSTKEEFNEPKEQHPIEENKPEISDIPLGINNTLGFQCFANSAMQLLYQIPEIRNLKFNDTQTLKEIAKSIKDENTKELNFQNINDRLDELNYSKDNLNYQLGVLFLEFNEKIFNFEKENLKGLDNGKIPGIMVEFEDLKAAFKSLKANLIPRDFPGKLDNNIRYIINCGNDLMEMSEYNTTKLEQFYKLNGFERFECQDEIMQEQRIKQYKQKILDEICKLRAFTEWEYNLNEDNVQREIDGFLNNDKNISKNLENIVKNMRKNKLTENDRGKSIKNLLSCLKDENGRDFATLRVHQDAGDFCLKLKIPSFLLNTINVIPNEENVNDQITKFRFNGKYALINVVRERIDEFGYAKKTRLSLNIPETVKTENKNYELLGIVKHSGTLDSGHYVAYIKGKDNTWYLCNDNCVTVQNKFNINSEDIQQNARLLLYAPISKEN